MPFSEIFFLVLIITFASFTQGVSGFGYPLIALPLLVLFMNIKTAVPLTILIVTCANIYLILKLHQHIPWKKLPILVVTSILGTFVGAYFLKNFSVSSLQILLGYILILFSLYEIFKKSVKKELHTRWEPIVGFTAGFLGGSISSAAPPIVIYCALQPWHKNTIKSLFVVFFSFINICAIISYILTGLITPTVAYDFLISIPFFILGTWLGHFCYQKISETLYRKIITYLLLLSGVLILYKTFA